MHYAHYTLWEHKKTIQIFKPSTQMNSHKKNKLEQAQDRLGLQFPAELFEFIAKLDNEKVLFGEEEWLFWSVKDKHSDEDDNYIVKTSLHFKSEWGLDGLVFATNGIGDYLLVMPEELNDVILVMLHETAELKLFSKNIHDAVQNGPAGYSLTNNYFFKIDEHDVVVRSDNFDEVIAGEDADNFWEHYELRSKLDDLIDEEKTEQTSDILSGLEQLIEHADERNKEWALNKLSDIYFKGFGPIPPNIERALEYNQQAIDLGSFKALSNRAACYFFGIGIDKDIHKAFALATEANELSKANNFADILASKPGGGMYDDLVEMIEKEIRRLKNGG